MGITLRDGKPIYKVLNEKVVEPVEPYHRPDDWLPIPEMDGTKDEVYILNGVGLNCLNQIYFVLTVNQPATIDWGDGTTTEISTTSQTTYNHKYSYEDVPDSSWTEHNQTKQVLIHISAPRGSVTRVEFGTKYYYTNADGRKIEYNSSISTDIYQISANVEKCYVYCASSSCPSHTNLEIFDWKGELTNSSMSYMFYYCYSLQSIPQLDTSNVTNISSMFNSCYSLQSIPQLDTSNVINMSSMFSSCYSLQSIPQLDTSNVTSMSYMFSSCYSLQSIPQLDTSNVTSMSYMFSSCYSLQSIPQLDTSNVTSMSYMFYYCYSLQSIPQLDTSNVTNMSYMFNSCYSLQSIPQLDTSNVTNMSNMFSSCYSLQSIPQLDTSNVINMSSMFSSCYSLQSIPQLDTSNVTNMSNMFNYCHSLQSIPQLDTSNVTSMSSMFYYCYSLQSIPQLDTSNVTSMSYMFYYCYSLQSIPQLDTSNVTNMSNMFQYCHSLTNPTAYNAGASSQQSITLSNFSSCTMMTKQQIVDLINSICPNTVSGNTRTLQLGTTLQGYLANCYVKDSGEKYTVILATSDTTRETGATYYTYDKVTGEYTQYIGDLEAGKNYQKLITATWNKYVICESTDTGAMLALDWARNIKNWTVS